LLVWFQQNPKNPRTRMFMDLSYIDPQKRVQHGFELHRSSNKGVKLLFQVKKANINQYKWVKVRTHVFLAWMSL